MKTRKKYFKKGSKRKYLKKGLRTVKRKSRRKTSKKNIIKKNKIKSKKLNKNGGMQRVMNLFASQTPIAEKEIDSNYLETPDGFINMDTISVPEKTLVSYNGKNCLFCEENFDSTKDNDKYQEFLKEGDKLTTNTKIKLHGKHFKELCKAADKSIDEYNDRAKLINDFWDVSFPLISKK